MSDDRSGQLDSLLAGLVARRLAGEAVDVELLAAERPEVADELRSRWADLERLDALWARSVDSSGPALSSSAGPLRPGDVVDGIEIVREIGRGGMGIVYLARQPDLGREIALKVLPGVSGLSEHSRARFLREARAVAAVSHPNVIDIHAIGEANGILYIAMELVEGVPLCEMLGAIRNADPEAEASTVWDEMLCGAAESRTREPATGSETRPHRLDPGYIRRACEVVAKVARGLHAAHECGVIHRDVNPSNVLIDRSGEPRIVDFGLAAVAWEPHVTLSGEFFGTPHYVSPEQARGRRDEIDRRTDVYSLGATMYECLTLATPFQGESAPDVLTKVINAAPRRPRELNGALARDLETIVEKCLEKDPSLRYATAGELADDINSFLTYRPIKAKPASSITRARKYLRRHPAAVVTTLLTVTVLAIGIAALQLWHEKRVRLQETQFLSVVKQADGLAYALSMPWLERQIPEEMQRRKQEALQLYDQALAIRPGDYWCLMQHALLGFALELDSQTILADVRRAAEADPSLKAPIVFEHLLSSGASLTWEYASQRWFPGWQETSAAADVDGASADDSYFLAILARLENDRKTTWRHLNQALRVRPDHYWALVARSQVGNYPEVPLEQNLEQGRRDAQVAVALRPEALVSYYVRARAFQIDAEYADETRAIIEEGLERYPDDPVLMSSMVTLLSWATKQYDEALEWATRALELRETAENHSSVARILEKLERYDEALSHLERGLRIVGDRPYAKYLHTSKASILRKLKRVDEAVSACKAALTVNPSDGHARSMLADLEAKRGNLAQAIEERRRLKQLNEDYYVEHEQYWFLSMNLEATGNLHSAEEVFAEGLALADTMGFSVLPTVRTQFAALRTRMFGPGAGDSVFEEVVDKYDDDPEFNMEYADYLETQGRIEDAMLKLRRAISLYPTRKQAAAARTSLARLLEQAGQLNEALGEFEVVLSDNPEWSDNYRSVSRVLRKLGRIDDAVSIAARGLESCGPDPGLLHELGLAYMEQSAAADAINALRRAVELIITNPGRYHGPTLGLLDDLAVAFQANDGLQELNSLFSSIRDNPELPNPFRLRAALRRAEALVATGDLEQAETAARRAAKIPEERAASWEGFLLLGKIQLKRGKRQEALVSIGSSGRLAPLGPGEPHRMLVSMLRAMAEYDVALREVDRWIEKGFTDSWGMRKREPLFEARYRLMRSLLLLDLKRTEEAQGEFEHALALLEETALAGIGDDSDIRLVRDAARRSGAQPIVSLASAYLARSTSHVAEPSTQPAQIDASLARANEFRAAGKLKEAEEVLRTALREVEAFDDTYPQKATATLALAAFLVETNRLAEAEPYLWSAVDAHMKILGKEDPVVIQSLALLGNVLARQGKWEPGEGILSLALTRLQDVPDLPEDFAVRVRGMYAVCLSHLARHEEALSQVKLCYDTMRKAPSQDSVPCQAALRWLVELCERTGRPEEAKAFRSRFTPTDFTNTDETPYAGFVAAFLLRNYASDPTAILSSPASQPSDPKALKKRAMELKNEGRLDEAEDQLRKALAAYDDYGAGHPERITAVSDLALFLVDRGKLAEAETLQRQCLDWSRRTFGEDSRTTIVAQGSLGRTLQRQKKWLEAERLLRVAIDRASQMPDIPESFVAAMRAGRAASLVGLWRFEDAIAELKLYHETQRRRLGDAHPEVQASLRWIARLYHRLGCPEKAAAYRSMLLQPTSGPAHEP